MMSLYEGMLVRTLRKLIRCEHLGDMPAVRLSSFLRNAAQILPEASRLVGLDVCSTRHRVLVTMSILGLTVMCTQFVLANSFHVLAGWCRGNYLVMCCSEGWLSPKWDRCRKPSFVRELVVCHSVINVYVSRVRLRGHDLWFLNATCKGYDSNWVPSTSVVSRFMFQKHHQNRWFNHGVW